MTAFKFVKDALLVSCLCLAFAACGEDDDTGATPDAAPDQADAAAEFTCDPVGAAPEVGALLNAPLESDVEVIVKTPQHPGDPGPTNLP